MLLSTHFKGSFYKRPYKFEALWITYPGCEKVIKSTWDNEVLGSPSFCLVQKIKLTKDTFKEWNKNSFGKLEQRKKVLENEFLRAQGNLNINEWKREKRLDN